MILYGVRKILHETPHGVFEGKSDQKKTQAAITEAKDASDNQTNSGINATMKRTDAVTARGDVERGTVFNNFSGAANNGLISEEDKNRLRYGNPGGSSGGGGGGGGNTAALPDYMKTWNEMMGKDGGFDPTRLGSVTDTAGKLKNTSGNYGDTDTSVHGLQSFAASGGVNDANVADIKNSTLRELADTGGYSAADKGNIRARSNAGVSSIYNNLRDNMQRQAVGSGQMNPSMGAAGFKLARQSAQDQGTNLRNTEADIAEKVRQGRMEGASKLSDASLGLSKLQSDNTLTGYKSSGDLSNTKQSQIDRAMSDSGNLELGTQNTINDARLRSAQGLSSDTLGRMSISASSAAANRSIDAQNERYLLGLEQEGKMYGGQGMLDTYKAAPGEQMHEEDLLRGYRQDQFGNNNDLIGDRISASRIPGIGSTIGAGLDNVMKVGKIASGVGFVTPSGGGK